MATDDFATRRKQLRHRSRYRGFLEMDLVLQAFADKHLDGLDPGQIDRYEALLAEPDQDLWAWITRRRPVPARHDHDVMAMLQRLDYVQPAQAQPAQPQIQG